MFYHYYFLITICIFYALTTVSTKKTKVYKKPILRENSDSQQHSAAESEVHEEDNSIAENEERNEDINSSGNSKSEHRHEHEGTNSSCWMNLNATSHFKNMDSLYGQYENVLKHYQKAVVDDKFDDKMLKMMLDSRGVANRDLHKVGNNPAMIPAGLNLGGHCMLKLPQSILFFHRMKLRNNTIFRVDYLQHDLMNMVLTVRLSLQDLHLVGAYERVLTNKDPSVLFYAPTYGEVEILLLNAKYKMEGRFRLLKDRLMVEHVISDISIENILLTYPKDIDKKSSTKLEPENIREFLERLRTDLDKWLKDYFNDYLMYFELEGDSKAELQEYDKKKSIAENEYIDNTLNSIKTRLHQLDASAVEIPSFTILAVHGMELKLTDGIIRGLDTLYRRSTATGKAVSKIRNVDAIVGFSNLKVIYKYQASLDNGMPPLMGHITLSADELTARMSLTLAKESESFELTFNFVEQTKPESLTIDGAANRVIANYRHILEHHIISLMSNTLLHNVRMLSTLAKCESDFFGHHESDRESENERLTDNETVPKEPNNDLEAPSDNGQSDDIPSVDNTPEIEHSNEETNDSKHLEPEDVIVDLGNDGNGGVNSQEIDEAFGPNVTRKEKIKTDA